MKNQMQNILLAAGVAFSAAIAPSTASAQTPYQGTSVTKLNSPALDVFLFFPALPSGKRLVLEQTRIRMWVDGGAKVTCEFTAGAPQAAGLWPAQYFLDAPKLLLGPANGSIGGGAGTSPDYLGIDQPVRLFVDAGAGSTLTLHCNRSFGSQAWTVAATIVGTLVDVNGIVVGQ